MANEVKNVPKQPTLCILAGYKSIILRRYPFFPPQVRLFQNNDEYDYNLFDKIGIINEKNFHVDNFL